MADKSYVDIELVTPATIAGAETKSLRMREPTVADQIAADQIKGSDAEKEVAYMANLCEVSPDDLRGLTLRNYRKVQEAFVGFTE